MLLAVAVAVVAVVAVVPVAVVALLLCAGSKCNALLELLWLWFFKARDAAIATAMGNCKGNDDLH